MNQVGVTQASSAMKFTNRQVQQLYHALTELGDELALRKLARFELGERLEDLADGNTVDVLAFNLIEWAERENKERELVVGALNQFPENAVFQNLATQLGRAGDIADTARSSSDGSTVSPNGYPSEQDADHGQQAYGDFVAGNKIDGDYVAGDKITIIQRVTQWIRGSSEAQREERNRRAMLQLVRQKWIDGVLVESLPSTHRLTLRWQSAQDYVQYPLSDGGVGRDSLAPQNEGGIAAAFADAHESLLILGEPGSGKTTLLLTLAEKLIQTAEDDPSVSIPVVFALSSWNRQHRSFANWLANQLAVQYHIPPQVAESWIEQDSLTLLLDGLDELPLDERPHCITSINEYLSNRSLALPPTALTCRLEAYREAGMKLLLANAIQIEPIPPIQAQHYLWQTTGSEEWVGAVRADDAFQEILNTPLALNIAAATADEHEVGDWIQSTQTDHVRDLVLDRYVMGLLSKNGENNHTITRQYSLESTRRWLSQLSKQMTRDVSTIFQIENMQPAWLVSQRERVIYVLAAYLLLTFIIGLVNSVGFARILAVKHADQLMQPFMVGFTSTMAIFASLAISITLIDVIVLTTRFGENLRRRVQRPAWIIAAYTIATGLMSGALMMVMLMVIQTRNDVIAEGISYTIEAIFFLGQDSVAPGSAAYYLLGAIVAGIVGGTNGGTAVWHRGGFVDWHAMIQTNEAVVYSWQPSLQVLHLAAVTFVSFALVAGLLGGILQGIVFASIMTIGFGFVVGLGRRNVNAKSFPNQGIWLTFKNGLWVFAICAAFFGATGSMLLDLPVIAVWSIVAVTWYGMADVLQHVILRTILSGTGRTPANYAAFLNSAVEQGVMRRAGGAYLFAHRILLEYFAESDEAFEESTD